MNYQAPLADMGFALKFGAQLLPALEQGLFGDLTMDDVEAVLTEAGRMAGEVIAPLNRIGDQVGATFKDGAVTTPPGWKDAYRRMVQGRLERTCLANRIRRPGPAADRQRRLYGNVEQRLDGVRRRSAPDHGRDRCA